MNGTTALSQTHLNNLEQQYLQATTSFNEDLFTAGYVLYGMVCSIDKSTANQLDITAGVAYVLQADGTTNRIAVSTTTETTSALSSTYYLYLQPAGTLYWNTANSPASNSIAIAQVTTNGSGNISGITDERNISPAYLPSLVNQAYNPKLYSEPAPWGLQFSQNPVVAGTVTGGVTFGAAGPILNSYDTAATFNGSTGYISGPTTSLPTGNGSWSIECWLNFTSASTGPILVFFGTQTNHDAAELYLNTSGFGVVDMYGAANAITNSAISSGSWHHLVGTYDGTTLRIYLDGTLQSTTGTPGTGSISYGNFDIGAQPGPASYYNGKLAHVAVYTTTLSGTRITAHYNAGVSQTASAYVSTVLSDSPVRYYRLADASGTTAPVATITATATQVVDAGGNAIFPGLVSAANFAAPSGAYFFGVANACNIAYGVANHEIEYQAPLSGVNNGHLFIAWTGASTVFPFGIGATGVAPSMSINNAGQFATIAGQATAGSFGVPVIVAQAVRVHVTATTLQTILTYNPTVSGLYRISGSFYQGNTTTEKITFGLSLTDQGSGIGGQHFALVAGTTSLDGSATNVGNALDWSVQPYIYSVSNAGAITVTYQDPANTPSDFVSVFIERLS